MAHGEAVEPGRGLLLARGFRQAGAVGKCAMIPDAMPAPIGDVRRYGVDPVEKIEQANGRPGAVVWRCRDLKQAIVALADAIGRKRGAGDETCEPLQPLGIFRGNGLSGED